MIIPTSRQTAWRTGRLYNLATAALGQEMRREQQTGHDDVSGAHRSGQGDTGGHERDLYWASGRSGVVNLVAAHKWFNLAALKGRKDAIPLRREVAALMSELEIATAQREARAW